MKKLLILTILALNGLLGNAQKLDLVVNTKGDSIVCYIDSVRSDKIFILCWRNGNSLSTYLDLTDVEKYEYKCIDKQKIRWIKGTIFFKSKKYYAKMHGFSINIMGTTPLIGISYDRILTNNLSFEAGIGIPSIGLGLKVYPYGIREQKFMFNLGLSMSYINSGDGEFTAMQGAILYFPVGFSYYGKAGLNFGLDLGPAFLIESYGTEFTPYGSLKLGKRF